MDAAVAHADQDSATTDVDHPERGWPIVLTNWLQVDGDMLNVIEGVPLARRTRIVTSRKSKRLRPGMVDRVLGERAH